MCGSVVTGLFPEAEEAIVEELGSIWDEVVHSIIGAMFELEASDRSAELHINIREDMVNELARLQLWLCEQVVKERIGSRLLEEIDPKVERRDCFGPEGETKIVGTAQLVHEHIWQKKMHERWVPKSKKATEREKSKRQPKLAVKEVSKNHFIPKWFLKDYWTYQNGVFRWKNRAGEWSSSWTKKGGWGYRHNLYSDELEAYFGLVEGDAKRPVQMLLDTLALNNPQRQSLIGFFVVQFLRNPRFVEEHSRALVPTLRDLGQPTDSETLRRTYEAMFRNNHLYDRIARPIMWSKWALVKVDTPQFVMPDSFGVRGDVGDGMRIIVPLNPKVCFVTLSVRETEKRIVPLMISGDANLVNKINGLLISSAESEFVSHPDFELVEGVGDEYDLSSVLREIEGRIENPDD